MNGKVNNPEHYEIRFRGSGSFRRFQLPAMDEKGKDKKASYLKRWGLCLICHPGESF